MTNEDVREDGQEGDQNEDLTASGDLQDEEGGFEDFDSGAKTSIGDSFRNNPLVKLGVILGGFAAVVAAVILFGGKKEVVPDSVMGAQSNVSEAPGTEQVSETYRQAVEEKNVQAVETAIKEGGSALPVPIAPPVGRVNLAEETAATEDPLERWRRIQEERTRQDQQAQEVLPQVDPNAEAVNQLASAMTQQMQTILQGVAQEPPKLQKVADADYLEKKRKEAAEAAEAEAAARRQEQSGAGEGGAGGDTAEIVDIIVPAGTIEYAQLMLEANSDVDGPILAQVVSGPLAGGRLIGSFEMREEYLVLNFDTVVIDGISHDVDAVAINPDTANVGMATDVDHRYLTRIILPAAASFIEGMASAIAETGNEQTSVQGVGTTTSAPEPDAKEELLKGVEKSAEKIGEILDDNAEDEEPLVIVAAGTPMGILFLEPVTEK